jgi:hypothetical protein
MMARAIQLGGRPLELLGYGKGRHRGVGFPFIRELGRCGLGKKLGKLLPASMAVAGVGAGLSREENGGACCSNWVGARVREVGDEQGEARWLELGTTWPSAG